jgi:hypothetical protein
LHKSEHRDIHGHAHGQGQGHGILIGTELTQYQSNLTADIKHFSFQYVRVHVHMYDRVHVHVNLFS